TYSWPSTQGAANSTLTNNGSGVLTWSTTGTNITGTGTANTIPKFTSASVIGNSLLTDSGSSLSYNSLFSVSSAGAISGATGLSSSGTITFSGIGTGYVKASSGTLSTSATVSTTDLSGVLFASAGNSGTSNISQGQTLTISGGSNITTSDNALGTLTINLNSTLTGLTSITSSTFTDGTATLSSGSLSGVSGISGSSLNINTTGIGNTSIGNGTGTVSLSLGSDATGDIYYRNSSGNISRLGIGTSGQTLTVSSGLPVWTGGAGTGSSGFWTRISTTLSPFNT